MDATAILSAKDRPEAARVERDAVVRCGAASPLEQAALGMS